MSTAPMLALEGVNTHYGHIHALRGIDVHVREGEVVTLIGANGAGKSTLMMTIFGAPRASAGRVLFEGQDITRLLPHEVSRRGIALVPEGRRIFPKMTVLENIQTGGCFADPAHAKDDLARVFAMFPVLEERVAQRAGTLSGGEQQMLAIARALMSRPKLLLLDEPSLGLAPQVVALIFKIVKTIAARGTTILLVEQNAHMALGVAHRAYVLEVGEIVLEGPAKDLAKNDEIRKAYLGIHD